MLRKRPTYYFEKDENKIENYEKAINDDKNTYLCHHRLETHFSDGTERPIGCDLSSDELKALGMYDFRPPEELIFLTMQEHRAIHNKHTDYKKMSSKRIGSHLSLGTKKKISESNKRHNELYGRSGGNYKKVVCIETNETFNSVADAMKKYGKGHISAACNGTRKRACGYHWRWA